MNKLNLKLSRPLSYDKNSSVAALRPPAALLHTAGRFASESLADFSGIRSRLANVVQRRDRFIREAVLEQGYLASQVAKFLACHPSNVTRALQKS